MVRSDLSPMMALIDPIGQGNGHAPGLVRLRVHLQRPFVEPVEAALVRRFGARIEVDMEVVWSRCSAACNS